MGELGQAGLNQTLKTLGAATAFQSIFGENIDKSDAGLTAAFNTVDVDSSGKISVKEMTAYIAMVYGGELDESITNKMFEVADTNKDGEVDLNEFKSCVGGATKATIDVT